MKKDEITMTNTHDLVRNAMDVSRELRSRWHEGLYQLCLYMEKTFLKIHQVVAWDDDKLYIRINKVKTQMVLDVLYTAIEDMETRYPASTYSYAYDAESDELVSFNAMRDGKDKNVVIILELATPMEDRPVFNALAPNLNISATAFMELLAETYTHMLPDKGKWPFERAMRTLKAWPSRQEGPPNLELILDQALLAPRK